MVSRQSSFPETTSRSPIFLVRAFAIWKPETKKNVTVRASRKTGGSRFKRGTYEGGDEQPAGVAGDPNLPAPKLGVHPFGVGQGGDHEPPEDCDGQAGGDPLRSRRGYGGREIVSSRRDAGVVAGRRRTMRKLSRRRHVAVRGIQSFSRLRRRSKYARRGARDRARREGARESDRRSVESRGGGRRGLSREDPR